MDGKREKLMLNQKPTLSLKPMLTMDMVDMEGMDTDVESEVPLLKLMPKPMLTTAMVEVMVAAMEVTVDMEDMDTDVESEVPLLKLMPKPMPTMDMVVMAEDMEVTVMEEDTVDTVMDVKGDQLKPTTDVVATEVTVAVMVAVMAVMVVTDTAVNKKTFLSQHTTT